ncbi:hypothetical protein EIP86_003270 [Pleurotus ostreatoroseus]|nr:hypothetical protein EIP86_003270 [Pleurotus ostreatoroseus]
MLIAFVGDMGVLFHRHKGWDFIKKLEGYGSVARVQGTFGSRVLFVFDPVALQHIVAKDGIQYESPDYMLASNNIIFGPGLLSVCGAQHRRQRKMLNPAFSADNLQKMTPMFYQLSHKLRQTLSELVDNTSREVDIIHWMGRAALEYVALGGMGHSFDSLLPHTPGPVIGKAIKNLVYVLSYFLLQLWVLIWETYSAYSPLVYALTLLRMTSSYLRRLGPPQLRRKLANVLAVVVPDARLGKLRDVVNTMDDASRMVFNERQAALEKAPDGAMEGIMGGNDILSLLLKAHANSTPENGFTDQELIAQMTTLIFAGTDTTSNALGRVLQALSEHSKVQTKLREELANARDYPGQDIPYDRLMELPLLDAICRETLRVYSPVNVIPRVTTTDVAMPLQKPVRGVDGRMMSELPVPKGTLILPCFLSCNTAKEIWGKDAEEWKPERWLSPLPGSVAEARIPGVYSNLCAS